MRDIDGIEEWGERSRSTPCVTELQTGGLWIRTFTTNTVAPCTISEDSDSSQRIIIRSLLRKTTYIHLNIENSEGIKISGDKWLLNIFITGEKNYIRDFDIKPDLNFPNTNKAEIQIQIYYSNRRISPDKNTSSIPEYDFVKHLGTMSVSMSVERSE